MFMTLFIILFLRPVHNVVWKCLSWNKSLRTKIIKKKKSIEDKVRRKNILEWRPTSIFQGEYHILRSFIV